jgi:hypothetical protein
LVKLKLDRGPERKWADEFAQWVRQLMVILVPGAFVGRDAADPDGCLGRVHSEIFKGVDAAAKLIETADDSADCSDQMGLGSGAAWLRDGKVWPGANHKPDERTAVAVDERQRLWFLAVGEWSSPRRLFCFLAHLGAKDGILIDGGYERDGDRGGG